MITQISMINNPPYYLYRLTDYDEDFKGIITKIYINQNEIDRISKQHNEQQKKQLIHKIPNNLYQKHNIPNLPSQNLRFQGGKKTKKEI